MLEVCFCQSGLPEASGCQGLLEALNYNWLLTWPQDFEALSLRSKPHVFVMSAVDETSNIGDHRYRTKRSLDP